jgi:hypothetical protein
MVFSSTFYHTLSLHKEPKKKKIHHSFSQISLLITHVNCQPLSHQVFLQTSLILTISFLFTNKKKKKKQKKKKTKIYSLSGLLSNTSPSSLVCRLLQQKLQIKNPIPCQKLFASPANGVSIQKFIFDVLCFTFSVFFLHSMLFFFLWQQPTSFFLDLPSSHRTSELSSALPQSHLIISLSVSSLCLGFQQTTISLSLSFSTSQSLSLYFLCFALDLTVCIFKSIQRCYQFMKSTKMRLPP